MVGISSYYGLLESQTKQIINNFELELIHLLLLVFMRTVQHHMEFGALVNMSILV